MRNSRVVVLLIVALTLATAVYLWTNRPRPTPPVRQILVKFNEPLREPRDDVAFTPEDALRLRLRKMIDDLESLSKADTGALEQQFRRSLKAPLLITADYDVPRRDYVPSGTHAWLQPLAASQVTESDDEVRWFEWLDDDTLVYSTLKGVYRRDLHGPAQLLVQAPMARMSYPSLSPNRKSVAAVVWGGILRVDTSSGAHSLHEFDKPISDVTWSPDSRLVGFTTRTAVQTLEPATGRIRRVDSFASLEGYDCGCAGDLSIRSTDDLTWSRDGKYISIRQIAHCDLGYFVVLKAANGDETERIGCSADSHLSWSPDSETIAYADSGDPHNTVFARNVRTGDESLSYRNGAGDTQGRSAWSEDGKYVAFECLGRCLGGWSVATYRALRVYEPKGTTTASHPHASRSLPFVWHPTRHLVASIVEGKPHICDLSMPYESIPSMEWKLQIETVSTYRSIGTGEIDNLADVSTPVGMPPIAGRKQTPRWSPDGKRLAVLCDISGHYEIWVTGLVSQSRSRRNGETWLRSARKYLETGENGRAIACMQNAVRLAGSSRRAGAGVQHDTTDFKTSLEARLLLTRTYLRLAETEKNPYQRLRLYRGAVFEASRVPFESLNPDLRKQIAQAEVMSNSIYEAFRRVSNPEVSDP